MNNAQRMIETSPNPTPVDSGTPAVVNGVIYFGGWHGVVHLLERHFPVRGGQADSLAAKR